MSKLITVGALVMAWITFYALAQERKAHEETERLRQKLIIDSIAIRRECER